MRKNNLFVIVVMFIGLTFVSCKQPENQVPSNTVLGSIVAGEGKKLCIVNNGYNDFLCTKIVADWYMSTGYDIDVWNACEFTTANGVTDLLTLPAGVLKGIRFNEEKEGRPEIKDNIVILKDLEGNYGNNTDSFEYKGVTINFKY